MIRGMHPRIAWVFAAVCFMTSLLAVAQPRGRTGRNANAATEAEVTVPTVASVPPNVCIPDEARQRATECPAGAQRYGSHSSTNLPAAVATGRETKSTKNAEKAGPHGTLDRSTLMRRRNMEQRSKELLMNEARLTATLVNRMNRNDPHRADTLMRLAEDYQELATLANGAAEDLEDDIFQARQANNAAQVQTLQRQQEQHRTESRGFREQLIATFRNLVDTSPNYPQMDRALFYLAFAYQDLNNFDDALRVYRTLIQRFPQSPFVPNAYLSFAEHYFEEGDMEAARQFYERVLAVQDESNQVYGYALYKMAWVLYNLQDHEGALQKFFEVIEYARQHPDSPSVTPLLRNARMELVTVYGSVYGNAQRPLNTNNALNTFRRYAADENNAFEMFEKLAELYHDAGQWPNSIASYHALMEARSTDDKFCFWQAQVARGVVASRPKPEQMTEVNRLVDVYNTYRGSQRSQEIKVVCRNHAARVLFDVASHWHLEAVGRSAEGQQQTRGTRSPDTMRMVAELYQKIIEEFPEFDQVEFTEYDRRDWPTRYRISYYRADILRDQGNNEACGPAYDAVVEMNPSGEFTEDAAYKAVLCYNDWFTSRFRPERGDPNARRNQVAGRQERNQTAEQRRAAERARLVPRELNPQEQGMLRAFTRYVCYVQPGGQQPTSEGENPATVMLTIKYRRAYLYYVSNKFEEAATLFREVANTDAATQDPENLREISADLYLDSLNVMGDSWNPQRPACFDTMGEEVPRLIASFCTATRAQHEDFCRRLDDLQCQILRKKAEALTGTHRYAEAARALVDIVRNHRNCGRLDEMLYNAAINYDAANLLGRAMRVRERMVQLFLERNSPWAQRALYRLAGNYHAIQVFGRAADLYEQYAEYVNTHRREALEAARQAAEQTHATPEDPIAQAADALRQATLFRIGLGEEDRALGNAQKFARFFGNDAQRRRDVANVVFSIGQIYADRVARLKRQSGDRNEREREIRSAWGEVVRHYSSYMRTYANQGTVDQQIQGAVALGRGYWNQGDTRQATTYFQQAVTAWGTSSGEGQPSSGERRIREQLGDAAGDAVEKSKDAVAEAKFYLAELLYNRFMGARLPAYSGGGNRRSFDTWTTRQLTPYVTARRATLEEATTKYREVIELHVPNWEIAAFARLADMFHQFARTIREAPVAPDIQRNADLLDAYNVLRDETTQPFIENAKAGFQRCIQRSTAVHWFNEWSQLCERSLNVIDRLNFPLADEVRVEPNLVFSRANNARPVYSLQTSTETEEEGDSRPDTSDQQTTGTPAARPQ